MKLKIKKGDLVKVISGNDKGNTGRVIDVDDKKLRILVEGINIRKKHQRPTQNNQKGGIVSKEMPIHYSNVMILDSEKKATRIGIKRAANGDKTVPVRFARTNSADL